MRSCSLMPLFLLPLLAALCPAPADAADLRPSATRIAVAGKAGIYRSYGLVRDAELYAPVGRALEALGVRITTEGRDLAARAGERSARWRVSEIPVELSVGDRTVPVPEGGEPRALRIRDELFLPVRAAAGLAGHAVVWEEGTRTLHLVPQVRRVEVTDGPEGLRLHVGASGPVRAVPLLLRDPWRLVVDLSPAVLQLPEGMPAAKGAVKTIRAGQFGPMMARVVVEAEGPLVISGLPGAAVAEFAAALSPGAAPARAVASQPRRVASAPRAAPSAKASPRRSVTARPRRLASRGGYFRRDPSLLEELRESGQAVLAGKVICVDAGHGGSSPGARGLSGLLEKDACLDMARELARALREVGAEVVMTREDDSTVSLDERVEFANSQGCDLFVSIHCNAMPRPNMASGTETYYYTPQSAELAQAIHGSITAFVGGRDGGVRRRRFAVVRRTTMPSVLVEVAYINHAGDEAKLADPDFRRGAAEAIRDGILAYYGG